MTSNSGEQSISFVICSIIKSSVDFISTSEGSDLIFEKDESEASEILLVLQITGKLSWRLLVSSL